MRENWKILFGVFCGLIAGGVILLVSRQPRGEAIQLLPPPTPAPLLVHVAGAVAHPGVYSLPLGSRAQDAINAAGGFASGANPAALNLAAPLQDGERLVVPTLPPTSPTIDPNAPLRFVSPTSGIIYPININTASLAELESLPGIGPKTAQAIIQYREEHGPFKTIEDIMNVPGIGPKTFEGIKDLITT